MVLTNYECWASAEGDNNVSDITLQQAQLRSQIDVFNPRALGVYGHSQKEKTSQQLESGELLSKVSQIASNGYYGFTYVNNNNSDDVACFGNDVNTIGDDAATPRFINGAQSLGFGFSQAKKRGFVDGNCVDSHPAKVKRTRLETVEEIPFSSPLVESNSMDVDDSQFLKETNASSAAQETSPRKFSDNIKNNYQYSYRKNVTNSPLMASGTNTTDLLNQNASLITALYKWNKTSIEKLDGRTDLKKYEAKKIKPEVAFCRDKITKSENFNEVLLEQMFSETHGSGVYYLQKMDENLYD